MRISDTQSKSLTTLLFLAMEGRRVIPNTELRDKVQKQKAFEMLSEHFRRSCHKLANNGFLLIGKDEKGRIAWKITQKGIEKARDIYKKGIEK